MAIQTKLGRVQGAGVFVTTTDAYLGSDYQYVSRSDLFPTPENGIKPMLGDCIIFANGVVGIVSTVQSSSTIGCRTNLFSLKGKDGLNITKVEQTTTSTQSGGINVVTFTLSDGSKHNVQIANGKEGGSGVDGLVVKNENDQNKLYLTKEGKTVGTGVDLPQGGAKGGTNYIANSNFKVNQRGKQIYDEQGTGRVYTFDRWAKNCATGNFVIKQTEPAANKAVPNDGSVINTVYFNSNLTKQQVTDIIDNANLPFVAGFTDLPAYFICVANNIGLGILKGNDFYTIAWQNLADNTNGVFYSSIDDVWRTTSFDFNGESISEFAGMQLGTHNEKLVQLISTSADFSGLNDGRVSVGGTFSNDGEVFVQPLEGALLAGQTITFSMQIPSLSGECMVGVVSKQGDTQTESYLAAKQGLNTISCTVPQNATQVVCGLFNSNATGGEFFATIGWAKLEVGATATQYLPPLPASDMAECQRFFQTATYMGAVGVAKSANVLEVTLPLPTTMRKTPTADSTQKLYINNAHSLATPTVTKAGNNCVCLSFATQNLVANNFYVLNDYTGFFDAELYEDE